MRWIRGKLADNVGDHVVSSSEGAVLVTSPGTKYRIPALPNRWTPRDSPVLPFGGAVNFFQATTRTGTRGRRWAACQICFARFVNLELLGDPLLPQQWHHKNQGRQGCLRDLPQPGKHKAWCTMLDIKVPTSSTRARKTWGEGEKTACPPILFRLQSRAAERALKPVPRVIVA